ncbi:MAG: thioredoxin domain-containing protein [Chthoniobacterales bacterium]
MSNRLASEQSPYLLQHANNPVDWFPWGPEAFEKARAENKPIFLSIGYSTCHWCHVMEHESFENEATARYLNEHFVSIKVDREERPDVDRIYMTFVQSTTGSGGWPMSVWLTPELKPFVGGTYFPPQDNYGRAGFSTVLARIVEAWETNHEAVVEQSRQMTEAIRGDAQKTTSTDLTMEPIRKIYDYAVRMFDKDWGGFGGAPKFPRPAMFNILIRISASQLFTNIEQTITLRMIRETLRAMARGGMHDHLGGGFHRYSVDRFWHVPHFEKMLYDQAQLVIAYLENWQRSSGGEKTSREIATNILEYVLHDLLSPEGGFYSAEDADSLPSAGSPKKIEGAFYVWKKSEIEALLDDDAEIFSQFYDVSPAGNAREGSDPHGEFAGENILYQKKGLTSIAKATGLNKSELEQRLERSRKRLLEVRNRRPRPHRDEKVLTSWNGLMISAFARCGAAFGERRYISAATTAADFILTRVLTTDGKLARSFCKTSSFIPAFTDDYAFLIQGLLDLYEATFDSRWLEQAAQLQSEQDALFYDQENGGYFSTRESASDIIARLKDDYDGAEPSANAIAATNLLRLATIKNDDTLRKQALLTLQSLAPAMTRMPQAVPQILVALESALIPPQQLVLAGKPGTRDFEALTREISRRFLPHLSLVLAKDCPLPMPMIDGKATAFLCENFVCQLPVISPADLAQMLDA